MPADSHVSVLIEGLVGARNVAHGAPASPTTLCLQLAGNALHLSALKHAIGQRTRLPAHAFHLTLDGRLLREEGEDGDALSNSSSMMLTRAWKGVEGPLVLRVVYRAGLCGGKGGFGSLLRGATTKVGAAKTTNFSASRDLSGRRMRHVEAEQQIAEWNAQHHEPVNQKELNAKYKAIKEGRPMHVQECKWGATCKYRYSTCRREHPPDPEVENRPKPVRTIGEQVPLPDEAAEVMSEEQMANAVSAGLKNSRKRGRSATAAAAAAGVADDGEERKEAADEGQSSDDDSQAQDGYSSGDDEERASKRTHVNGSYDAPAASSSAAAAACVTSSPAAAAASGVSFSSYAAAVRVAPTPSFPQLTHRAPQLAAIDQQQAGMGLAAVLAKAKEKAHVLVTKAAAPAPDAPSSSAAAAAAAAPTPSSFSSSSAAAAAASAAAPSATSFSPIDLSAIGSAAELQGSFDAAHLAHELGRQGLKAGGTHEQKAQRLFMLKGTTIDKLPKKVLASA